MDRLQALASYLDSMGAEHKRPASGDRVSKFPFITISRQTGSGGHTLAQAILDRFAREESPVFRQWEIFDQEICKMVADSPNLNVSLDSLLNAEYRSMRETWLQELVSGRTPQEIVQRKIFETILSVAKLGKVIIVGRGGASLTRAMPMGIHLRLVAPLSVRIARMMRLMSIDEAQAAELVQRQDDARRKLIKVYFHQDIDDPLNYDAVWNTDHVPIEAVADSTVALVRARFASRKAANRATA